MMDGSRKNIPAPPPLSPSFRSPLHLHDGVRHGWKHPPDLSIDRPPGNGPDLRHPLLRAEHRAGPGRRGRMERLSPGHRHPRFPDGFTYWEANGQWRGADNRLVQERSMVLQIVHPDTFQAESAIQEIIHRYEQQYEQDSVLRLRDAVQVWF